MLLSRRKPLVLDRSTGCCIVACYSESSESHLSDAEGIVIYQPQITQNTPHRRTQVSCCTRTHRPSETDRSQNTSYPVEYGTLPHRTRDDHIRISFLKGQRPHHLIVLRVSRSRGATRRALEDARAPSRDASRPYDTAQAGEEPDQLLHPHHRAVTRPCWSRWNARKTRESSFSRPFGGRFDAPRV